MSKRKWGGNAGLLIVQLNGFGPQLSKRTSANEKVQKGELCYESRNRQ